MKNTDKFTFTESFLSSTLCWLTGLHCLPPLPRPQPPWPKCHYLVINALPLGCLLCTGSSIPDHVDAEPIEMSTTLKRYRTYFPQIIRCRFSTNYILIYSIHTVLLISWF